jgi:hypothetical protein
MKKITLVLLFVMLCFSKLLGAQGTASATVSATIVTPIQIIKNSDIDFGNFATNGGTGTVVLGADNTGARTSSSNISMPNQTGAVNAAGFTVTGEGNAAYSITLPANEVLIYNGIENMVVDGFTSSASNVLSDGKEVIYLGATLHVGAGQAIGSYSSLGSGMEVSVNYN